MDMSKAWIYSKNVSKKPEVLDISFFLATEQVQKFRVQKNTLPTSFGLSRAASRFSTIPGQAVGTGQIVGFVATFVMEP
jgi:hypothetical protein